MKTLRVGLAQINTTIGDLEGNVRKVREWTARARDLGVDIVAFPELTITGYPPEDLLLRPRFIEDNLVALDSVMGDCRGLTAIVGYVDLAESDIYNAAAVIHDGRLIDTFRKQHLPNYGVFDELRYFRPDETCPVYTIGGFGVGVNICEDIWYAGDPTRSQALGGAQVIININGSPYHAGKSRFREEMVGGRARDYSVLICYVNQVGGQDELVFDGASFIVGPSGELLARAKMFEEDLLVYDVSEEQILSAHLHDPRLRQEELDEGEAREVTHFHVSDTPEATAARPAVEGRIEPELSHEAEVYAALVTGTRDYLGKTGFKKALVALSGGIDSSIVAAVAVDALGAENVIGIGMPSRYSSEGSIKDAQDLANNLGIRFIVIPIEPAHAAYLEMLERPFAELDGGEIGVAEENIQSRIRGNVIMALSNKFGWIVLTTGNKSEFATGYATLYGDMSGGYAVIKDVPKTLVYAISRYRNTIRPVIPESIFTKPPSAELKPGQLDQDTLPPYDILDPIIERYVENDRSVKEIVADGFDEGTVIRVVQMINRNEYKRRQAPPGVKITPKAFGRDRRLPIANKYAGL
jgi:NAD+ synthase (glutamine-hydrolysing)